MESLITKFIEERCLVKIDSEEESLFLENKLPSGFLLYLIMELEERHHIRFRDEDLKAERFDTVRSIIEVTTKALEESGQQAEEYSA